MTKKNNAVNTMLISILTIGTFSFAFTACSDELDAIDKAPSADDQKSNRKQLLEPIALNFFDFDKSDDVQILNADTTLISVSKAYAEKMGIRSFVDHPTGVWQDKNLRPFHVRATSERLNGDRYELTVQRAGIGEFLAGKGIGLDTRFFINEDANLTRGANGDLSSRYTDSEGYIHPIGVRITHIDAEPSAFTRGIDSYESEYFTAEELLGVNDTRGFLDFFKNIGSSIVDIAKKAVGGHYFTIDKNGNIINIETTIKADPSFGCNGDTINVHIKAPAQLNLNYKFYLDVDRDYLVVPILNKFEAGVDGRFAFKPQITIGCDGEKKLANVKREFWKFNAYSFTFFIGPVPFWVDVQPSMYLKFDAAFKGSLYTGFKYEYERTFKGGVRYLNNWDAYGETNEVKNEFTIIPPTASCKAEAGLGLFLGVDLIIDKVAGPTIAVGPKISAEAEMKVAPTKDKPIDFNAEFKAGIYAEMGAKLKFWEFKIADWNTTIRLVPEKSLLKYEYPSDNPSDDVVTKTLDLASETIRKNRDNVKDVLFK